MGDIRHRTQSFVPAEASEPGEVGSAEWNDTHAWDGDASTLNGMTVSEIVESPNTQSVEYYGAVGDGVTDDTVAIQAAIDANSGGTIVLAKGASYVTTSRLTMGSYSSDVPAVNIVGNGATILAQHTGTGIAVFPYRKLNAVPIATNYTNGDDFFTVSDPSLFQHGDVVRLLSSELYHPSRSYYYLGGSTTVREVVGNVVYITKPFPFDMLAANTTVTLFTPPRFTFSDLTVVGDRALTSECDGISVEAGAGIRFDNVTVDNFSTNMVLQGCVDTVAERYMPRRSYYTGTTTSYGVNLSGCNGTTFIDSRLVSGRHGIAHGGLVGVNFDTVLVNCTCGSEKHPTGDERGLDTHANTYSLTVIGGYINGFVITGNCSFHNVRIGPNVNNFIIPAASKDRCNVKFDNCNFGLENRYIYCRDTSDALSTNQIGSLVFENCRGTARVDFRGTMADDTTPKPNSIGLFRIKNTDTGIYQWNQDSVNTTFDAVDVVYYGTAAPTTGPYRRRMVFMNNAPSAGGYLGWVCVSSGTPGTWKGFGAIEA